MHEKLFLRSWKSTSILAKKHPQICISYYLQINGLNDFDNMWIDNKYPISIPLQLESCLKRDLEYLGLNFNEKTLEKYFFMSIMKFEIKGYHTPRIPFSLQYVFFINYIPCLLFKSICKKQSVRKFVVYFILNVSKLK